MTMSIAWLDFYRKEVCIALTSTVRLNQRVALCNKKLERNTIQRDKLKFFCAHGDLKMTPVKVFVTFPETLGSYTFFANFYLSGPAHFPYLTFGVMKLHIIQSR